MGLDVGLDVGSDMGLNIGGQNKQRTIVQHDSKMVVFQARRSFHDSTTEAHLDVASGSDTHP